MHLLQSASSQLLSNITHHFSGGTFEENSATSGHGGAVYILMPPDQPTVKVPLVPDFSLPVEPRTWNYNQNTNTFEQL